MSTVLQMLTCATTFGWIEKGSKLTSNSLQFLPRLDVLPHVLRRTFTTKEEDIRLYDIKNNDNGVLELCFYASLENGRAVLPVDALEAAVTVSTRLNQL